MSCPTYKVSVGIPVFGLGFTTSNQLIVGGGGGVGRSGVKNKLSSYKVDARRKDLEEDATFEFGAGEDAPMCLDVHPFKPFVVTGVNCTEEKIKNGQNENCRHFEIGSDKFILTKAINTLKSKKAEDYQRVVRFSEDGNLIAVGTTDGKVNVFKYPEFESISKEPIFVIQDDEVLDVDINLEKEKLTCVLRDEIKLINLRGKNIGHIIQTISTSTFDKNNKINFRAFRYGRGFSKDFGFAVANGTTKPSAYIIKYDAYSFDQKKVIKVSPKPITAFTLSQDGGILAFASADLSITLMDTQSFRVLTKVKDAHSFSITSIAISPDRRLLASASADNTCCIVSLPLQFSTALAVNPFYTLMLALVVAGVLLWITTLVDLGQYVNQQQLSASNNIKTLTPTTTVIMDTTPVSATIESIMTEIIAETPFINEKTLQEPVKSSSSRDEL